MTIWLFVMFLRQELQKIVKDLFLLINETNADKASQEVLVKTGLQVYSCSHFQADLIFNFGHNYWVHFQRFTRWTRTTTERCLRASSSRLAWPRRSSARCSLWKSSTSSSPRTSLAITSSSNAPLKNIRSSDGPPGLWLEITCLPKNLETCSFCSKNGLWLLAWNSAVRCRNMKIPAV